jgi:transcriptional regulator of acetoin/glycerol metabolism
VDGVARDALEIMLQYAWPGNVRELRNAVEHAFVTVSSDRITVLDLPAEVRELTGGRRQASSAAISDREERERREVVRALEQTDWNRTQAAKLLGYSRVTLWKKMNRLGIEEPEA